MPKAYIVTTYRSISNSDALAEYAKLAGPAMIAAGGRFLARGNAAKPASQIASSLNCERDYLLQLTVNISVSE